MQVFADKNTMFDKSKAVSNSHHDEQCSCDSYNILLEEGICHCPLDANYKETLVSYNETEVCL